MTKRRRKYTQKFKAEAVKLVLEHGYKITEAAKNLGYLSPIDFGKLSVMKKVA